ncbi:MAG: hypothetical protein H8E37_09010 [Planctomycetes bacterium]|nr:hypothetical protein [Planctomycetota bacterium]
MAIMAAAIRAGKIEALFSDSPTHDVKVQFPAAGGGFSKEYNFEDVLSLGASQAELSGDYNAAGEYEVWPQVLEMALLDDEIENGGSAPTGLWDAGFERIWNILTGKTTVSWQPDDKTLPDFIDGQIAEGRQVVLGTNSGVPMPADVRFPTGPYNARHHGDQLTGNHAYLFMGWTTHAGARVAQLYNVWGVIPDSPENGGMPRNRSNILLIAESDLNKTVFNRADGLKE